MPDIISIYGEALKEKILENDEVIIIKVHFSSAIDYNRDFILLEDKKSRIVYALNITTKEEFLCNVDKLDWCSLKDSFSPTFKAKYSSYLSKIKDKLEKYKEIIMLFAI